MTAASWVANGASLEDCHSNLFSLADLTGIKWRRYTCGLGASGPVIAAPAQEDPILHSFVRSLQTNLLAVWRRNGSPGLKELWVYWWGDQPNLGDVIHPELRGEEEGSWDNGLTYECRTLLFKAIHNLLERCLFNKSFVRIGKWFVKPYERDEKPVQKSEHLSCSFSFFLHGDSNVCTSVEICQHAPLYRLDVDLLDLASASSSPLNVILSPYGLNAVLTGQAYKRSDASTRKLIEEWQQFYPVVATSTVGPGSSSGWDGMMGAGAASAAPGGGEDGASEPMQDEDAPVAVEVLVGGVRMVFPAALVLVPQSEALLLAPLYPPGGARDPTSCGTLTPPTSPPHALLAGGIPSAAAIAAAAAAALAAGGSSPGHAGESAHKWANWMVEHSWEEYNQDRTPLKRTRAMAGSDDDAASSKLTSWDFLEPSNRTPCCCSRHKVQRQRSGGGQLSARPAPLSGPSGLGGGGGGGGGSSGPFGSLSQGPGGGSSSLPTSSSSTSSSSGSALPSSKHKPCMEKGDKGGGGRRGASEGPPRRRVPSRLSTTGPRRTPRPAAPVAPRAPASPSPLPPTLSPHPRLGRDLDGVDGVDGVMQGGGGGCHLALPPGQELGETALYAGLCAPQSPAFADTRSIAAGATVPAWSVYQLPYDCGPGFGPPGLPSGRSRERLLLQPSKRLKVCEERLQMHRQMHSRGAHSRHGGAADATADPYAFNDVDDQISIGPGKKERPGGERSASKRAHPDHRVGEVACGGHACVVGAKDAMSIFSPAPKSGTVPMYTRPRSSSTSLMREVDLRVSFEDLENLFDNSSDDDMGGPLPAKAAPPGGGGEERHASREGRMPPAPAPAMPPCSADLQRMFPTPPSLEQHPAFSPVNPSCKDYLNPDSAPGQTLLDPHGPPVAAQPAPFRPEIEDDMGSPKPEELKDFSFVFRTSRLQPFVGSSMFAPLKALPSGCLPPVRVPDSAIYRPSWTLGKLDPAMHALAAPYIRDVNLPSVGSLGDQDYLQMSTPQTGTPLGGAGGGGSNGGGGGGGGGGVLPSPATPRFSTPNPRTPRTPRTPRGPGGPASIPSSTNYNSAGDLYSPAASTPSTFRPVNSVEPPATTGQALPEAHSLYVTLILSDTVLNLFRDRNFDSCCLCACNMNIKGADVGLYLPDPGLEIQRRCSCGFSAVVNRRLGPNAGLFLEDELDIVGGPLTEFGRAAQRRLECCGQTDADGGLRLGAPDILDSASQDTATLVSLLEDSCNNPFPPLGLVASPSPPPLPPPPLPGLPALPGLPGLSALPGPAAGPGADALRLDLSDGSSECVMALEAGRQYVDNPSGGRMEETAVKGTLLHHWPERPAVEVSSLSSQDVVRLLGSLQPVLQDAIQKKRTGRSWENVQHVQGPLTWQQFHKMAGRGSYGTEESPEPLPIPHLLVGYDRDCLMVSPFSLPFWDKLLLEPFGSPRDIAYVVVCPENDALLHGARNFFRDLSTVYENCRLGLHRPITKVLRDGIMRVGRSAAQKVSEQPVDEWFSQNVGPPGSAAHEAFSKLRLFAQVCRHRLGPHLATQQLDSSLLAQSSSQRAPPPQQQQQQPGASAGAAAAPASSAAATGPSGAQGPAQADASGGAGTAGGAGGCGAGAAGGPAGGGGGGPNGGGPNGGGSAVFPGSSAMPGGQQQQQQASSQASGAGACSQPTSGVSGPAVFRERIGVPTEGGSLEVPVPPAVVVYIVDPFTSDEGDDAGAGGGGPDDPALSASMWTLGLLRCYLGMVKHLPKHMRDAMCVQVVPSRYLLQPVRLEEHPLHVQHLKSLAFSVYAQCRRPLPHPVSIRTLTGFGPAAAMVSTLRELERPERLQIYSPPFILAPVKDKQTELGETFGEAGQKHNVLFVGYCLSHDQRWLLAACTDLHGELLETAIINIHVPNRSRRGKVACRRFGLNKLWEWCLGVMQLTSIPWRVVIGRLGRVGHGELKDWHILLGRRALQSSSRKLKETCRMCGISAADSPSILSACLVAIEPQGSFFIMPDSVSTGSVFGRSTTLNLQTSQLSTPQDASCTHILVFPTSAAMVPTPNFNPEHLDFNSNNEVMDILEEDIFDLSSVDPELSQLINLHPSPTASPGSPSGSPSGPHGDAPYQHGQGAGKRLLSAESHEEVTNLLQQPLALGYYVSTAPAAPLPQSFWASCPQAQQHCPLFLKASLHLHVTSVQSDELLLSKLSHPLDSSRTSDVLRFVLEHYNALSWLSCDPATQDRRSCLPVHLVVLTQLYNTFRTLL
ncbi:unnamed protein product [Lampetra planeri]